MPDASPTKWHLAHTTWFFETFILKPFVPGYEVVDEQYDYLFNSYYNSIGEQFPRARRGMITRPGVDHILEYRHAVDDAMGDFLNASPDGLPEEISALIALGLNHEQQHQELLLTDIKHGLSVNPAFPAFEPRGSVSGWGGSELEMIGYHGGLVHVGYRGDGFCFDNELPEHKCYVYPFSLASRLVTNGEYQQFVADGGYRQPGHWLSDGWSWVQAADVSMPLYWHEIDGQLLEFTLHGLKPLKPAVPVCHVNYFEACAYASWAGKRLPTEQEWEIASRSVQLEGDFMNFDQLHPRAAKARGGLQQMFGDVWQWTQSAYNGYPGFKVAEGAVGEYNGKFMCGQQVLRGASCVTSPGHARHSYRNFFPPGAQWQFSGIRLAQDVQ
jgi:ergothioneine biosynthesis protein EgtB